MMFKSFFFYFFLYIFLLCFTFTKFLDFLYFVYIKNHLKVFKKEIKKLIIEPILCIFFFIEIIIYYLSILHFLSYSLLSPLKLVSSSISSLFRLLFNFNQNSFLSIFLYQNTHKHTHIQTCSNSIFLCCCFFSLYLCCFGN